MQICHEHGFLLRQYKYTTADGYINTVWRLYNKEEGDMAYTLEKRKRLSVGDKQIKAPKIFKAPTVYR